MVKNLFTSNFKKMPKEFIVGMLLILFFEMFLAFLPEYKKSRNIYESLAIRLKVEQADKRNDYDLIVLGDCFGWSGIRPVVLEQELNMTAYNFATNLSHTYMMQYLLLKKYLRECEKKPELVVLQISDRSFIGSEKEDYDKLRKCLLPYLNVDEDLLEEFPEEFQQELYKYKFTSWIPSVRYQYLFKKNRWKERLLEGKREEYDKYYQIYIKEKGYFNQDTNPFIRPIDKIFFLGKNLKKGTPFEFNWYYLDKIIGLLKQSNVKVLICGVPVRSDELELWEIYDIKNKYHDVLVERFKEYKGDIAFWNISGVSFNKIYFADVSHLNGKGADKFTKILSQDIVSILNNKGVYPLLMKASNRF